MKNATTALNGMRGEQLASVALLRRDILPLPFPPNYPKFDLLALNQHHDVCAFLQVKYNADKKPVWKASKSIEAPSGKRLYYIFIHDHPERPDLHVHYIVPEEDLIAISRSQNAAYVCKQQMKNPGYIDNDMRVIDLADPGCGKYLEAFDRICQCHTLVPNSQAQEGAA